ncbi:hypothetical protein Egran_04227 [Elaphomyces granulatus]|uniref:Uncharacterized protein n=1 Tax=Elaphomyces granulatus TaxID=519963 RepID=A0A232LV47_9EURO|nr:hypothetical protein Egran_04227 [Elaphomyces granulatus]
MYISAIAILAGASALGLVSPIVHASKHCPPITGDFNVTYFRLYTENFDYDFINCKAYFGSLFNSTVLRKDLGTGKEEVLTFPGISGNDTFHLSGVLFNRRDAVYMAVGSASAFKSGGVILNGPNRLIKYNVFTNRVVYTADVDPVLAQLKTLTGNSYNGFQDIAEDENGNAYFIATFGGAILKVTPDGTPSTFFYTTPVIVNGSSQPIWSSVFATRNVLVVWDAPIQKFLRFDTTSVDPGNTYTSFPLTNTPGRFDCDRLYLPMMFDDKIALCSNGDGTYVFYSDDLWQSAKYLGLADSTNTGGVPSASAQMSNSIYTNSEFFSDSGSVNSPGNRSVFPFTDITREVLNIVPSGVVNGSYGD